MLEAFSTFAVGQWERCSLIGSMLTGTCLCLLLRDAHPQLWDGRFQLSSFGMITEDFSFRGCTHQHVGFSGCPRQAAGRILNS